MPRQGSFTKPNYAGDMPQPCGDHEAVICGPVSISAFFSFSSARLSIWRTRSLRDPQLVPERIERHLVLTEAAGLENAQFTLVQAAERVT